LPVPKRGEGRFGRKGITSRQEADKPILTFGSFGLSEREVRAMVPAVRGSLFQFVLDHVQRLLDAGQLTRKELAAQLTPDDLDILSTKIGPATWVPIDTYRRTFDLLVSIEAPGDPEGYLFERGWRAAEGLHKTGLYSQFEASTEKWGMRVGKLIVTLGPVIYNFTEWSFEFDPGPPTGFRVTVRNAAELPECGRFAAAGFIEYLARSATGLTLRITSERLPGGNIIFTGAPSGGG
jgi:hypothetical protein